MGKSNQEQLEDLRLALKAGKMGILKQYYLGFKPEFLRFARRFTSDQDLITDSYHDSFIIFYENLISGKLSQLTSSLKTYVFSIGKYTLLNKLKQAGKIVPTEEVDELALAKLDIQEFHPEPDEALKAALGKLSKMCREIITMYYYRKYNIETIMYRLRYKNENTVKAQKSRCMRALKKIYEHIQNDA